jgi:formate-dependent nitrite reductase membrane component NrfD
VSVSRPAEHMNDWHPQVTPSQDVIQRAKPRESASQGYESVPILKRPLWGWEIASYFFLEGISASAFILCTAAEMTGGKAYTRTTRAGRMIALAAMMPCPWLLIHDLGRPGRFHHMLRVVKLKSPMNLGSWGLTGYGAGLTMHLASELPTEKLPFRVPGLRTFQRLFPATVSASIGMPFAITLISYPGVLLGNTSIPMWSHTKLMGSIIACSSMSSGTSALKLVAEIVGDKRSARVLDRFELVASGAEAAALAAYFASAGKASTPLLRGKQKKTFWLGAVLCGLVVPAVLRTTRSRSAHIVASLMALGGAFALKWAFVHAGKESAMDRELASGNADPRAKEEDSPVLRPKKPTHGTTSHSAEETFAEVNRKPPRREKECLADPSLKVLGSLRPT